MKGVVNRAFALYLKSGFHFDKTVSKLCLTGDLLWFILLNEDAVTQFVDIGHRGFIVSMGYWTYIAMKVLWYQGNLSSVLVFIQL